MPIVQNYCRRKGIQSTDVDDVAQEVLLAVAKSIQTFEYVPEKGRFRSWMGTVTANRLKSYFHKRGNRQSPQMPSGMVEQLVDSDPDSEWTEVFSQHIFQTACSRVQGTLEPTTWQCFQATWINRRPAAEVAQLLGIPVHSVYVNKSRVLKRLEEEVKLLTDDPPFSNNES